MAVSDFLSGGATIVSDKLVSAFTETVMLAMDAERKYNNANKNGPINGLQGNIQVDNNGFSGTLAIPYDKVKDIATSLVKRVVRNYLQNYEVWTPGNGFLAATSGSLDALILIAEEISYLEPQIETTVVQLTPNTIQISDDEENNSKNIIFNFPVKMSIDPASGKVQYTAQNYLYPLDLAGGL